MTKSLALFLVVVMANTIPSFFVYGEPERPLEIGFLHVETVMARAKMHLGQVEAHKHDSMAQITFWTGGKGSYFIEDQRLDFSGNAPLRSKRGRPRFQRRPAHLQRCRSLARR